MKKDLSCYRPYNQCAVEYYPIGLLKKKIFIRTTLLGIDCLRDIFEFNEYLSGDEVFEELVRKALREFEVYYPLIHECRVAKEQLKDCNAGDGWCTLPETFDLWMKDLIAADQIILPFHSPPKMRPIGSLPGIPTSYAVGYCPVEYRRPNIYLGDMSAGLYDQFYLHGICSRPVVVEYNPDHSFKETSAIYFMPHPDKGGVLGNKFTDQVLIDTLDYIRSMKANFAIPNMSVDIFNSCDIAYQTLKGELDNWYLQSGWKGELLI